jgi:hypothetical protein
MIYCDVVTFWRGGKHQSQKHARAWQPSEQDDRLWRLRESSCFAPHAVASQLDS